MIGLSLLVLLLALDGAVGRLDGGVLIAGLCGYLVFLFRQSASGASPEHHTESRAENAPLGRNLMFVVGGLGLLVLGSRWFVEGAVTAAQALGVSEQVIGLTIIAAGTSLPEVVTSIIAALRGERDIAVGNVVGSNVFNILGVLGLTGMLAPSGIAVSDAMVGFDIPVMIAVALACLPICITGGVINRWEGAVLFAYYLAYTLYLILAATSHDALPAFSVTMLYFALPLTALTLLVLVIQERRRHS